MKKNFIIALMLFVASMSSAQRYDWVRTLHGASTAGIGQMVIDGTGNLYVRGTAGLDLMFDTTVLRPLPSNYGYMEAMHCPMKVSSGGSVVWHKYLYGHNELVNNSYPTVTNMKMLGDTSLLLFSEIYFPSQPRYRLMDSIFIIDTLLFSNDTGFLPPHFFDSVERFQRIGFPMLLDASDGHLQEYHTMEIAFVGDDGRLRSIYSFNGIDRDTARLFFDAAHWIDFDIDGNGNFVGITYPNSYFYRTGIRGMCYMIDNERRGEIPPPTYHDEGNKLLVRFSPHFDSLLAYQWLFDSVGKSYGCNLQCIKTDSQGNIYTTWYLDVPTASLPMHLTFAGNRDLGLDVTHNAEAFFVKFSPDLVPLWVKHIRSDWPDVDSPRLNMGGIAIDKDSNTVFVTGVSRGGIHRYPVVFDGFRFEAYHGIFIFQFTIDDGRLVSYAKMDYTPETGEEYQSFGPLSAAPQMVASRGRVWFDILFQKGFTYGDTAFYTPDTGGTSYGEGIVVMDYQGRLIDFIDFRRTVIPSKHNGRFLAQHDSVLTLGFYYGSGEYAWFGDTCVMANDDIGVIARYVDPAYAVPYGQPVVAVPEAQQTVGNALSVWPNPTRDVVHLACGDIKAVWLVAADGRRTRLRHAGGRVSLAAFPPGLYMLEVQTAANLHYVKVVKI